MTETEAKQAADDLNNAIYTMETIYADVVTYLDSNAESELMHSKAYKLLEQCRRLMVDIGQPYTKLSAFTHE